VIVQISNAGPVEAGPFEYSFLEDVLDPNPAGSGTVERLAAGENTTLFIPHVFSWWGAFVMEVRIDTANNVRETDEFNNFRRSPIVTGDGPLALTFEELPDGTVVDESRPVEPTTFSPWGVRLEAVPNDDPACAGAVPWIVVHDTGRYLGTGLPDDMTACVSLDVQLVAERADVGGVSVGYLGEAPGEYTLSVFDRSGAELDRASGQPVGSEGTLSVSASFPARLAIRRAVFSAGDGTTRIVTLALEQPAGVLR